MAGDLENELPVPALVKELAIQEAVSPEVRKVRTAAK
jgi:hypothetical protein